MSNKKKTREGFNFYRSYYDVYNELNDKDKVAFMDALLSRQFEGIEPEDLKGMAKFGYISQKHSIDRQIKGWEDKTGEKLTPSVGGSDTPSQQVQVQGEVQVQVKEEGEEESSDSKNLNVFSSEVFNCFDSIKIHFPENVLPTTQKTTDNWLDVIDKLNRIDGLTFEEIEIIVKWVRNDNFWKQNFLSITKLRKKNSEGIHYWKVFINKIQAQHGQKQSTFEAIANWGNDYNPDWSDKAGN